MYSTYGYWILLAGFDLSPEDTRTMYVPYRSVVQPHVANNPSHHRMLSGYQGLPVIAPLLGTEAL